MTCSETFVTLQLKIDKSNHDSAHRNSNQYIIQEQASIEEVFEQYECSCSSGCTCRKFGCTSHWRLKDGLTFQQFANAYLRMFVHRLHHGRVLQCLATNTRGGGRIVGLVDVLLNLQQNWNNWYQIAQKNSKTLLCDDWEDAFPQRELQSFHSSVYWAKQWAMMFPDTCVPYDSNSRIAIRKCTGGSPPAFSQMLESLRQELVDLLTREKKTVSEFRKLDEPGRAGLPFNQSLISLANNAFNYGTNYSPDERPLSRVIDKVFYTPATNQLKPAVNANFPANNNFRKHSFSTLSGHGKTVTWTENDDRYDVVWGNTEFSIRKEQIEKICESFFGPDAKQWKALGASMTNPTPDGLGAYLLGNFNGFTPRHASAIATLMVYEGLIEFEGKKPILLRLLGED